MFLTNKSIRKMLSLFLVALFTLTVCIGNAMAIEECDHEGERYIAPTGEITARLKKVSTEGSFRYIVYIDYISNKPITQIHLDSIVIKSSTANNATIYFSLTNVNKTVTYTGSSVGTTKSVWLGYFELDHSISQPYTTTEGAEMYYSGIGGWFVIDDLTNQSTPISN